MTTAAGTPLPGTGPLTPAEIAFLAESQPITIIPRQRLDRLPLISGTLPPFHPPQRAAVPLWLALLLKRQRRCSIVPPGWLAPARLEALLKAEADSPAFAPLPFRWLETAELLLEVAADDVGDVRVLLRAIREARQGKVRALVGGGGVVGGVGVGGMAGLGAMEVAEVRGFVVGVVDGVRRIAGRRGGAGEEEEEEGEEEEEEE